MNTEFKNMRSLYSNSDNILHFHIDYNDGTQTNNYFCFIDFTTSILTAREFIYFPNYPSYGAYHITFSYFLSDDHIIFGGMTNQYLD